MQTVESATQESSNKTYENLDLSYNMNLTYAVLGEDLGSVAVRLKGDFEKLFSAVDFLKDVFTSAAKVENKTLSEYLDGLDSKKTAEDLNHCVNQIKNKKEKI